MKEHDSSEQGSSISLQELQFEIEEFLAFYLPETSNVAESGPKVLHDALWGTLKLTPVEIAFIDTPLLQRLRQIRQLGGAYLVYPSATHSRFEHTLGVMLNIEKLGRALVEREGNDGHKRLSKEDVEHMRLAALFHDIGHGPFSHTSEEIYRNLPVVKELDNEYSKGNPHEKLAFLILNSERFGNYLDRVNDKLNKDISISEIAHSIIGNPCEQNQKRYKMELINGPFDSDKLDYLFRDGHFTGLPLSVDLDRLWYTVRIGKAKEHLRLIVTQSGATALEQIIFSKMILTSSVYQHHKIRTCDCMFGGVIEYMRENDITLPIKAKTSSGKTKTIEIDWSSPVHFLWVTDASILAFGQETEDENLHKLIHGLFFRNLLKRCLIISNQTIDNCQESDLDELHRLAKNDSRNLKRRRKIAEEIWKKAGEPCLKQELWLDLPEKLQMKGVNDTFVMPSEYPDSYPITLNDFIPMERWTQLYQQSKWRGHVFCPEHAREKVAKAAREVLEDTFGIKLKSNAFNWCKIDEPS